MARGGMLSQLGLVALLLVACRVTSPAPSPTATAPAPPTVAPTARPDEFPTATSDGVFGIAYATALTRGELFAVDGCLWIMAEPGGGMSYGVVWPRGYQQREVDGVTRLFDERGVEVAREGDRIEVGGGEGPAGPATAACLGAGTVWFASPTVRVLR